ncbi:MAG: hypothetical protein ABIF11_10900 [Nitrospirota bacterium]
MKKTIFTTILALSFMLTMVMSAQAMIVWLVDNHDYVYELGVCTNAAPHYDLAGQDKDYGDVLHGVASFTDDGLEIGFETECYEMDEFGDVDSANYNVHATLNYNQQTGRWEGPQHWYNTFGDFGGVCNAYLSFTEPVKTGKSANSRSNPKANVK